MDKNDVYQLLLIFIVMFFSKDQGIKNETEINSIAVFIFVVRYLDKWVLISKFFKYSILDDPGFAFHHQSLKLETLQFKTPIDIRTKCIIITPLHNEMPQNGSKFV